MKILEIKHNPSTVVIEVELDNQSWQSKVKSLANQQMKKVKIDGFRVGKVPAKIAEKYVNYGDIYERAANSFLNKTMDEIEADEQFKNDESEVVGIPSASIKEVDNGHCIVDITYDLAPVVTLPDYTKITFTTLDPITELDDQAAADYFKRLFKLAPETELTDELIAGLNHDDIKTVSDALVWAKNFKKEEIELRNRQKGGQEISKFLLENTKVSHIPQSYLTDRVQELLKNFEQTLKESNMTRQDYLKMSGKDEKAFYDDIVKEATGDLIVSLALEEIITKEKIEVTPEEFDNFVARLAKLYQIDPESMKKLVHGQYLDYINASILNNKVIDKLMGYSHK